MSSRDDAMKTATIVSKINGELSVKDKEDLVYLVEILIPEYATNKALLWLLGELRRIYCTDRGDARELLVALLQKAGLDKHADNLRSPKELRPPTLGQYKYITEEKLQQMSMRSSLIKLRHGLNADTLQILLQMLCLKIESNPDNYENIYKLFRELEQKAEIFPGNLGFVIVVLKSDAKFTNVVHILERDEGERRHSNGNNPQLSFFPPRGNQMSKRRPSEEQLQATSLPSSSNNPPLNAQKPAFNRHQSHDPTQTRCKPEPQQQRSFDQQYHYQHPPGSIQNQQRQYPPNQHQYPPDQRQYPPDQQYPHHQRQRNPQYSPPVRHPPQGEEFDHSESQFHSLPSRNEYSHNQQYHWPQQQASYQSNMQQYDQQPYRSQRSMPDQYYRSGQHQGSAWHQDQSQNQYQPRDSDQQHLRSVQQDFTRRDSNREYNQLHRTPSPAGVYLPQPSSHSYAPQPSQLPFSSQCSQHQQQISGQSWLDKPQTPHSQFGISHQPNQCNVPIPSGRDWPQSSGPHQSYDSSSNWPTQPTGLAINPQSQVPSNAMQFAQSPDNVSSKPVIRSRINTDPTASRNDKQIPPRKSNTLPPKSSLCDADFSPSQAGPAPVFAHSSSPQGTLNPQAPPTHSVPSTTVPQTQPTHNVTPTSPASPANPSVYRQLPQLPVLSPSSTLVVQHHSSSPHVTNQSRSLDVERASMSSTITVPYDTEPHERQSGSFGDSRNSERARPHIVPGNIGWAHHQSEYH